MSSYSRELNDWMSIILQIWDNFYLISLQFLTKKKQKTRWVYQDSQFLTPLTITLLQKVTENLNLTCKNI